ncbi:MAG: hypothetical protein E4G98_02620 [Promethearchaeota archaeon]|nr:MAG: hypothetical protein E4G98_02620 [Candidatus Lokiarchaeota archaeon]
MKLWAGGKIILVGLLFLTCLLSIIVSPDLSDPNRLNLEGEDFLNSFETGILIIVFILLFLFFFIGIGGFFQIFLYFQMLVDLEKMSRETSSRFLRNMFRIEIGKLGMNLIAYILFILSPGTFFYIIAALISCGSFFNLVNLNKWAADRVEAKVKDTQWISFTQKMQIWKGGLIASIILYIIAMISVIPLLISWILILLAVGIANYGLYRATTHFVHT